MHLLASAVLVVPGRGQTLPSCIGVPELTEGPFFADIDLERSDIRVEPSTLAVLPGISLILRFLVSQVDVDGCAPLKGALVNVWQCDALGRYSGFSAGGGAEDHKFLRGYQKTDDGGMAEFLTIFPGWYPGRAVHIHFKIRTENTDRQAYEFTSQLFFDEDMTDRIHANEPYAAQGVRTTRNEHDGIYRNGGDNLILDLEQTNKGFASTFSIGLDLADVSVGRSDGRRRPERRGRN